MDIQWKMYPSPLRTKADYLKNNNGNNPPEVDDTPPAAVSAMNDANGYFVSPAYVKGTKPADAVDVLWRYNGQTEWHYIQRDDVDAGKDAVVADTWWWTEISLEYELTQGQITNVTAAQRAVEIEIATIDAAGNISTPVSKTLNWNITHIGDGDHLIQMGEKMILAGPADPGQLPSGGKTITITGDDIPTPLSAAYTDASTPNWIVEFDAEGNHRTHTATITLDADSSTLSSTSTDIHVIKKLHVEVVRTVADKPQNVWEWGKLIFQMLWPEGSWTWMTTEDAKYAIVQVPRSDSRTTWTGLEYSLVAGERLPWWAAIFGGTTDLWWSSLLENQQEEICTRVTYDGCILAHDSGVVSQLVTIPPKFGFRYGTWFGRGWIVGPEDVGTHTGYSVGMLVFTCRAGWLDISHVRQSMDLTMTYYLQLHKGATAGKQLRSGFGSFHGDFAFVLKRDVTANEAAKVAAMLAYEEGLLYEVIDDETSAFTPEDLPSNAIGVLLALRALEAGGPWTEWELPALRASPELKLKWGASMDAETQKALQEFVMLSKEKALRVWDAHVRGKWVDEAAGPLTFKKRNFSHVPWTLPCDECPKVPNAAVPPDWVKAGVSVDHTIYDALLARGIGNPLEVVSVDELVREKKKKYPEDQLTP